MISSKSSSAHLEYNFDILALKFVPKKLVWVRKWKNIHRPKSIGWKTEIDKKIRVFSEGIFPWKCSRGHLKHGFDNTAAIFFHRSAQKFLMKMGRTWSKLQNKVKFSPQIFPLDKEKSLFTTLMSSFRQKANSFALNVRIFWKQRFSKINKSSNCFSGQLEYSFDNTASKFWVRMKNVYIFSANGFSLNFPLEA